MEVYELQRDRSPFEWYFMMVYPMLYTMLHHAHDELKKFYDLIYDKSKIFGKIKKKKFEEIFCASDEKSSVETVLTEETAEMPIVNQASNIEEGSSTIPEMGVESSDSKCTAPNE